MARSRNKASHSSATGSTYRTRARLWRWAGGKASWYFFTLPKGLSDEIRLVDAGPRRVGFGSLRVQVTIGETTWETSLFPASGLKAYILPVKASVRKAEQLAEGKTSNLQIAVKRAW